jgi:SAM-dependent methyltransferase
MELGANARRFEGFASLYDDVRPSPPADLAALLIDYAGGSANVVADLGCGTGLSSRWVAQWARQVIGIEPSADMRARAEEAGGGPVYRDGWSHATGLDDSSVDVVLAAQALHWMEPDGTFTEVARILRPGGVFAALDCDWPPSIGDAECERAWRTARALVACYERRLADGLRGDELRAPLSGAEQREPALVSGGNVQRGNVLAEGVRYWSKDEHRARMQASGRFAYVTEVAMTSVEPGDGDRFVALFRSQGDYQALVRNGVDDAACGVDDLTATVRRRLRDLPRLHRFVYRIRIGMTALTNSEADPLPVASWPTGC